MNALRRLLISCASRLVADIRQCGYERPVETLHGRRVDERRYGSQKVHDLLQESGLLIDALVELLQQLLNKSDVSLRYSPVILDILTKGNQFNCDVVNSLMQNMKRAGHDKPPFDSTPEEGATP